MSGTAGNLLCCRSSLLGMWISGVTAGLTDIYLPTRNIPNSCLFFYDLHATLISWLIIFRFSANLPTPSHPIPNISKTFIYHESWPRLSFPAGWSNSGHVFSDSKPTRLVVCVMFIFVFKGNFSKNGVTYLLPSLAFSCSSMIASCTENNENTLKYCEDRDGR